MEEINLKISLALYICLDDTDDQRFLSSMERSGFQSTEF